MWAAGGGHVHVAKWLVEEVGAEVDAENKERRTALQWACKTGQLETARYLLAANADPTRRMKDDSTGARGASRPARPSRPPTARLPLVLLPPAPSPLPTPP